MAALTENNFGNYLFLYRTEAVPKNISMQRFCMRNGIKYDEFVTWYKKTQKAIETVVVVGEPEEPSSPIARTDSPTSSGVELTYSVSITTSSGLKLSQEGLSYQKLKPFVLFFYDNGSRGRQVLTDFLGSAEIVALQSDGYNAYTFLDNELTDIEHMMTVERKRSSYAGLLPTGRKNSLMFGSHKGAEMSAIFHTFIETCKINGISTIEYFKKLLSELLTGNNNYASLLPQTIGIRR